MVLRPKTRKFAELSRKVVADPERAQRVAAMEAAGEHALLAVRRRRRRNKKTVAFLKPYRPHYDRLLEEQGGVCGVCGRLPSERRRFDMDHDHRHLYLRGLLCPRCNRALPSWITPQWLRAAADYLEHGPHDWLEEAVSTVTS